MSVKEAVRAIEARIKSGKIGTIEEVHDIYRAIADDLIICVAAINSNAEEFELYSRMYNDYVSGSRKDEPVTTLFQGLIGRFDNVAKDIAALAQLRVDGSHLLEYIPSMASTLVNNLMKMKIILMTPSAVGMLENAGAFLKQVRQNVLWPLSGMIAEHKRMLGKRLPDDPARVGMAVAPLEQALKGA